MARPVTAISSMRVPLVFRLLARCPLGVVHALGVFAGWLTYIGSPRYRSTLKANLRRARPDDPAQAFASTVRSSVAQAGRQAAELPYVLLRPTTAVLAITGERNWQIIDEAKARGRGILFLTPHLGCFEVTAQYFAARPKGGAPITVLYRPPRKSWLSPLIETGRRRDNVALAPADLGGVRALLKALRRGEAVGLLPDQVPARGEGVWAPYFGAPAYTMTLPLRLWQQTGATLVLAVGRREPNARGWTVEVEPFPDDLLPALSQGTEKGCAAINEAMERLIARCPSQYLWGYNRYKTPAGVERPAVTEAAA